MLVSQSPLLLTKMLVLHKQSLALQSRESQVLI
jgi:hypothetical protein